MKRFNTYEQLQIDLLTIRKALERNKVRLDNWGEVFEDNLEYRSVRCAMVRAVRLLRLWEEVFDESEIQRSKLAGASSGDQCDPRSKKRKKSKKGGFSVDYKDV